MSCSRDAALAQGVGNLFEHAAPPEKGEHFETLLACRNLVVERIVSSATVEPNECVQSQDEWVVLIRGEAVLDVAGEVLALRAGDHVFLPAGTRHTVTSASNGALWLAVHVH
jgi:cupin 2 domain-containing protein